MKELAGIIHSKAFTYFILTLCLVYGITHIKKEIIEILNYKNSHTD